MARPRRRARTWHRILGVILALPLLVVSLTGVLLNHTVGLRLDERTVSSPFLMRHYHMGLSGDPTSFVANPEIQVTQWNSHCFFNEHAVASDDRNLLGAVSIANQVILAFDRLPLEIYDSAGQLQLQVDDTTYPGPDITKIGQSASGQLVVASSDGKAYHFSEDLFECAAAEAAGVSWSTSSAPSSDLREAMRQAYRGDGLPWSRVLLDLHSGRIFGSFGPWLLDLSVLGLLVLVFTGLKLSLRPTRL